ncbi:MAG: homoserine O-succinyltransferase, partial [Treponema sp.]|nr:homoserine O-succinyltransferase [Treponema sp.]
TELQFLRLLGRSAHHVEAALLRMESHESRGAPPGHMEKYYTGAGKAISGKDRLDALVITGAPVEALPFREVGYWRELCELFDTLDESEERIISTLHICWGAQAALYRRYGIAKKPLEKKLFGVFPYKASAEGIFRGFQGEFLAPQSRHTESDRRAMAENPRIAIRAESAEAGILAATARGGREVYVSGHFEYDGDTLALEYRRDLAKGLDIAIPKNYFPHDDSAKEPEARWKSAANLFFENWLDFIRDGTRRRAGVKA